jgi:hypothetical protein
MSHFPQGLARAWVSFDASSGTPSIGAAFNTTITDDGVGIFTLNFTRALADANYAIAGSARYSSATSNGTGAYLVLRRQTGAAKTASTCKIQTVYQGGPSLADLPECNAAVIGLDS